MNLQQTSHLRFTLLEECLPDFIERPNYSVQHDTPLKSYSSRLNYLGPQLASIVYYQIVYLNEFSMIHSVFYIFHYFKILFLFYLFQFIHDFCAQIISVQGLTDLLLKRTLDCTLITYSARSLSLSWFLLERLECRRLNNWKKFIDFARI